MSETNLQARRTPEGVRTYRTDTKKASGKDLRLLNWWALRGSNSRPSRCKRDALPAELSAHLAYRKDIYTHKKNKSSFFFTKNIFFLQIMFFQTDKYIIDAH